MNFLKSAFLGLLISTQAVAGLPPTTSKGQSDAAASVTFNLQAPGVGFTRLGGTTALIETGAKNYAADPGVENSSATGGWSSYADAAAASPVDGTAGAATLTCTRTTSSPLSGTGSLLITKDAVNRQGEGCSKSFTIDRSDLAKVLSIDFSYEVASGTYDAGSDTTDSDLTAWVYGPTDGTPVLTQLAPYKVLGLVVGQQGKFQGSFQTAATGSVYRLILHQTKTGTSAYTLKLDSVSVGPGAKSFGTPVTDWDSCAVTMKGATNGLEFTNQTTAAKCRRVGDVMHYRVRTVFTSAPGVGTGLFTWAIPQTIDTAKLPSASDIYGTALGSAVALDNGTASIAGTVTYQSTTSVAAATDGAGSAMSAAVPITWASGDRIGLEFSVPVTGWSSNVLISSDASTRVVATKAYATQPTGTIASTLASSTTTILGSSEFDKTNSYNTTTGEFTVPVPGVYLISGQTSVAGTESVDNTVSVGLYKDGALVNSQFSSIRVWATAVTGTPAQYGFMVDCVAGNILTIRTASTITTPTFSSNAGQHYLQIHRLSGPAQIAASETVTAKYNTNAGQSIDTATNEVVDFEDKLWDSHGAVTVGASWKFTAPVSGTYSVAAGANYTAASFAASTQLKLMLYKNGAEDSRLDGLSPSATASVQVTLSGSTNVKLLAGDYIDVRTSHGEAAARALHSTATLNSISIDRVGNY